MNKLLLILLCAGIAFGMVVGIGMAERVRGARARGVCLVTAILGLVVGVVLVFVATFLAQGGHESVLWVAPLTLVCATLGGYALPQHRELPEL